MTDLAVQIQELLAARVGAGEPGAAVGVYRDGELADQAVRRATSGDFASRPQLAGRG